MEKRILHSVMEYMKEMDKPQDNLLELLLVAQKEAGGYLYKWLQEEISSILEIPLEEIQETIEFFPFLREKKEMTKISLCMGTSCYMAGNAVNERIFKEKEGNIFELEYKECEEVCEYGPRVNVKDKVFHFVDEAGVEEIISYVQEDEQN